MVVVRFPDGSAAFAGADSGERYSAQAGKEQQEPRCGHEMGQRRLARCWPAVVPDVVGNEPTIADKVDCADCHPHGQ